MTGYRLAADIGGTFTDVALLSETGALATAKVPSTPHDYAIGILDGCRQILAREGLDAAAMAEFLHASTVATNAILEGKGARTALVTTEGFRDVLELRRIRVPRLYEPLYQKPQPLVPRRHRFEVRERIAADGSVVTPLDERAFEAIAEAIVAADIAAVAVCFLNSFTNPDHERRAGELLRALLPGRFVTLSVDVLPEVREYERTSTTVINAYVGPPVEAYLNSLTEQLADAGIAAPLRMMQSSGGLLDIASVIAKPAQVVESGPAAGVIGAARLGMLSGYEDIITLDMGGTTAKAAVIEKGRHVSTDEYEVGGGISLSSRLVKGGGYALRLPVIDVSEVGAGGGSLIWRDGTGHLKVGPHSAGAWPGPACYGRGGTAPTVTDANVVLGYLNPTAIAGGTVPIDAEAARAALASVAEGRDLEALAYGVVQLAATTMMRAVKAVTTYRGRDPRDFTLFAFGGGGGLYAADLARALGIRAVVVPPAAGVFSAVGLLFADLELALSRGYLRRLARASDAEIAAIFTELEASAVAELKVARDLVVFTRRVDVRYAGQAFELPVEVPQADGPLDFAEIGRTFDAEHEATYGHRLPPAHPKEIVALRVTARVPPRRPPTLDAARLLAATPRTAQTRRSVFFGALGRHDTAVIGRGDLSAESREGPLVIEEYEGTSVVPPDCSARLDGHGNVVIAVG
ncbi:hydantoinase/oxoprolinase family protein [Xanthobacter sp. KR7-65]|uniref:hydantoinase/oxoprolinase family protein n=1 Tax=Xanthobacter sp. KR7-65 TaxID=3156612 RepID=UPI0032B34C5A